MKKQGTWKKRIFLLLLALFFALQSGALQMTAYADDDDEEYSDEADDDEIADAVNRLSTYYKNMRLVNEDQLTEEQLGKLEKICNDARNYIAGTDDITSAQVEIHVSETKALMDSYLQRCLAERPQSTVDYLAVGNIYDAPVAKGGEGVVLILPILNLGEEALKNVIVTPVISGSVKEWPFEISRTGYAEEIGEIPGSHNIEEAYANHREVRYALATRQDVLTGYYKLDFNIVYEREGKAEKAVLSTYIKTIGAEGSGMLDEEAEGSKTSTPRIIVTGFETDPADVYAGSTFMLTIHVKNTSARTAVSNVEFDLEAAKEGEDENTLYASFLPTSGSNAIYVPSIPSGGEAQLQIEMTAKADLVQKPYAIDMTMKYEDDKYNPYENKTSLSVPVKQLSRIEYSSAEILPESITVGGQANVVFNVYNTGKTTLYNVKVRFEDETVSGGDAYVGKLESGATGSVDTMLNGVAATTDDGMIKTIISYENDAGEVTEVETEISLFVTEELPPDDLYLPEEIPEETPGRLPLILGAAAAGIVIAIIIIVLIVKRRKKKRAQKQKEDDLAELLEDSGNGEDKK
ncbi:MAG: hypothetical protein J6C33_06380 [Lachnospiraceae bacterium]|nr:hypothetical protein [Lachnospiraceae bacterium]